MAKEVDFQALFARLKAILKPYEDQLVLKADQPGNYYLDTHHTRKDGYQVFFGAVQIKKNYVSYHLMPLYGHPGLLEDISPELKKRMQGKSCFNFKRLEPELLEELARLTHRGFQKFKAEGLT